MHKRRENARPTAFDHFRPPGMKLRIDEDGNLPEVFLDDVPNILRSHPE